jgi:hypothetical protein
LDSDTAHFWLHYIRGIAVIAVDLIQHSLIMYNYRGFKALSQEMQIEQLGLHGIGLDLERWNRGKEAVLFAYGSFYVELLVERYTDEILGVKCFQSTKWLAPYLHQVNIDEITSLLTCSK